MQKIVGTIVGTIPALAHLSSDVLLDSSCPTRRAIIDDVEKLDSWLGLVLSLGASGLVVAQG